MSHSCRVVLLAVSMAACSSQRAAESPAPESPRAAGLATDAGAAAVASDAPAAGVTIETLFVGAALAACQGEEARKCLLVRSSANEPWRNLYASIEGFEYEPSFEYELRVEVTPVAGAPADAPSLRYRLLEVVSKRAPAAP